MLKSLENEKSTSSFGALLLSLLFPQLFKTSVSHMTLPMCVPALLCVSWSLFMACSFQAHVWAPGNLCLGRCFLESIAFVSKGSSLGLRQTLVSCSPWEVKTVPLRLFCQTFMLYLVLCWGVNCGPLFLCYR